MKPIWPIWLAFLFAIAFDLAFWGPLLGWDWTVEAFAPLCHQRNERCLHFGDTAMAICSRCAGIYAGVVFGCLRVFLGKQVLPAAGWFALMALFLNGAEFFAEKSEWYGNLLWIRLFLGISVGWLLIEFAWKRENRGKQALRLVSPR